ncbi:MAG TPA: FAD-dependent oxidoreductase [Terriglobales bacterium]|nr:FAD-dependent oxidoreductase [Terriglobales bacterium]
MPTPLEPKTIAIVGGGPAGALAAAMLAKGGRQVLLFDEKLAWEKPCGGGITHKALTGWPFLAAASVQRNWVRECELVGPSGRAVSFRLQQPIAIFSRLTLNGLLLERAHRAGAQVFRDRIVRIDRSPDGWRLRSNGPSCDADYVIIAAGARNSFRKQFSTPFAPEDLMVTAGYFIPGQSKVMQIQFLNDIHGYIWIFPRLDHFSAGICGKMHVNSTAELRKLLEQVLEKLGLDFADGQFYSHILPSLRSETFSEAPIQGEGWAFIGDAAGFVDPITGEGLYYAMRSAELLSRAILEGEVEKYCEVLRRDFLPELELAAKMSERFYRGTWMGESVLERTIQFTAGSASFRLLMSDLFAGIQGYLDLRRRLYRTLPSMLAESLATALSLPTVRRQSQTYPAEIALLPDDSKFLEVHGAAIHPRS